VLQQPNNLSIATVQPNGCGGTITATISAGGKSSSKSYPLVFTAEKAGNPITINGANTVCEGNRVYALNYIPPGAITQWNLSSQLEIVSSTNSSITLRSKSGASGIGTISMSCVTLCGSTISKSKTVWVGKPVLTGISGPSTPIKGTNQNYTATGTNLSSQNITNYVWTYSENNCLPTDPECWYCVWGAGNCYGQTIKIRIGGPVNHVNYLVIKAENICGFSPTRSKGVVPKPGSGFPPPQPLVASNLVDESLEISFVTNTDTKEELEFGVYNFEIELYDFYAQKKAKEKSSGEKVSINTKNLKEGIYVLITKVNGLIYNEKIVVKHK
jgi:hypothetical protein